MGYGVMAYAVGDPVWATIGCRSEEVVSLYEWGADDLIEFLDEALAAKRSDGRPVPDARTALRQMVMGEEFDERAGIAYGYWFKRMCESGRFLRNDAWMPIRMEFFDDVQRGLDRAGVTGVSVRDMVFGGLPIPLPPPDDFPGMGCTSTVEAPTLLAKLGAADLSGEPDRYVREAIEQLRDWLRTCADSELDLVCFYH
jgi:hypothetical protein